MSKFIPEHPDTPDYAKQIGLARTADQLRMIAAAIDGDNTLATPERNELLEAGRVRWRELLPAEPLTDRAPCRVCGVIIECLPDGLPTCESCAAKEAAEQ